MLGSVITVGVTLLLGGVVLLFVDNWFRQAEEEPNREVSNMDALVIGLFQVISMIPGVSRSAATIVGGLSRNLNRKTSAEFSFFLAVPTMFAATCFKLYKSYKSGGGFTHHEIHLLLIGNAVAFVVALIAIKGFITYLTKHGFKIFGWYRIGIGLMVLFLYFIGFKMGMV
jgi:undecaprenyl-diphosphatase